MLLLTCALQAEANPIIQHFKLKKVKKAYPIFENASIRLIITGTRKTNALISTSYLFGITNTPITALINIGIAGHKTLEKGTPILAHKLLYKEKAFYPTMFFTPPIKTKTIISIDEVETKYEIDVLYDMEAYFIFEAASRFLQNDLIHFFKVISDNALSPPSLLTKNEVSSLIEKNIPLLDNLISFFPKKQLIKLPNLEKYRLTFTEKEKAKKLLTRLFTLEPNSKLEYPSSKKELFSYLETSLNNISLKL